MTPRGCSRTLTPVLETIALGALLASSEFGVFDLSALFDRHQHPALLAARAIPLFHLLLWALSRRSPRLAARLGLATIELVLACALSAELYLPLAVLVFFAGAGVAVSCHFMDNELRARCEVHETARERLPSAYLGYAAALSAGVVALGFLIFPLLPRTRTPIGTGLGGGSAGYTENVQVSNWTTVRTRGLGASASVLRLFTHSSEAQDLQSSIYLGLLRGRVLDQFDGIQWSASPKARQTREPQEAPADGLGVQVVREALGSEILPLPYGALQVHAGPQENRHFLNAPESGEWTEPGSEFARSRYEIELRPFDLNSIQPAIQRPTARTRGARAARPPAHTLDLPGQIRDGRLLQESRRIFAGAHTPQRKIAALLRHFSSFEAVTDEEGEAESAAIRRQLRKAHLSALEEFLLIRRRGHCEWFASATAVLLRMTGIPSRLVSGFRLSRESGRNLVILRSSDAHSWVEAWTEERGWFPIDPTPRVLKQPGAWERLMGGYEILSAYWYRYGVTYDRPWPLELHGWEFPKERWTQVSAALKQRLFDRAARSAWLIGIAAALSGILLLRLRPEWRAAFLRRARRDPADSRRSGRNFPRALRRERRRLEKLLGAPARSEILEALAEKLVSANAARAADALTKWRIAYERARFGPAALEDGDAEAEWTRRYLRERAREIVDAGWKGSFK